MLARFVVFKLFLYNNLSKSDYLSRVWSKSGVPESGSILILLVVFTLREQKKSLPDKGKTFGLTRVFGL
jgi:hypothetical protein